MVHSRVCGALWSTFSPLVCMEHFSVYGANYCVWGHLDCMGPLVYVKPFSLYGAL